MSPPLSTSAVRVTDSKKATRVTSGQGGSRLRRSSSSGESVSRCGNCAKSVPSQAITFDLSVSVGGAHAGSQQRTTTVYEAISKIFGLSRNNYNNRGDFECESDSDLGFSSLGLCSNCRNQLTDIYRKFLLFTDLSDNQSLVSRLLRVQRSSSSSTSAKSVLLVEPLTFTRPQTLLQQIALLTILESQTLLLNSTASGQGQGRGQGRASSFHCANCFTQVQLGQTSVQGWVYFDQDQDKSFTVKVVQSIRKIFNLSSSVSGNNDVDNGVVVDLELCSTCGNRLADLDKCFESFVLLSDPDSTLSKLLVFDKKLRASNENDASTTTATAADPLGIVHGDDDDGIGLDDFRNDDNGGEDDWSPAPAPATPTDSDLDNLEEDELNPQTHQLLHISVFTDVQKKKSRKSPSPESVSAARDRTQETKTKRRKNVSADESSKLVKNLAISKNSRCSKSVGRKSETGPGRGKKEVGAKAKEKDNEPWTPPSRARSRSASKSSSISNSVTPITRTRKNSERGASQPSTSLTPSPQQCSSSLECPAAEDQNANAPDPEDFEYKPTQDELQLCLDEHERKVTSSPSPKVKIKAIQCRGKSKESRSPKISVSKSSTPSPKPKSRHHLRRGKKSSPLPLEEVSLTRACVICSETFKTARALGHHMRSHKDYRPHACTVCGKTFTNPDNITVHMQRHLGHKRFGCDVCGRKFIVSSDLKLHMRRHTGERPFMCDECGKSFIGRSELNKHKSRVHTESNLSNASKPAKPTATATASSRIGRTQICDHPGCTKSFAESWTLKSHQLTHVDGYVGQAYSCTLCPKTYARPTPLKEHMCTAHSAERQFKCDICQKSFALLRVMQGHRLTHTGERNFTCEQCGKTFKNSTHLNGHMKIHTFATNPETKATCEVCGKGFSRVETLNAHKRVHTGEKPYVCDVCGKAFRKPVFLKEHSRTHTGEKPFKCGVCGKGFAQRANLKMHELMHQGFKKHVCGVCGKGFTLKQQMQVHESKHH